MSIGSRAESYFDPDEWRPARRNPDGIHCAVCDRIFAGGYIPIDRVCRDCRADREQPPPDLLSTLS